jgi:hypothetical protein
MRRLNVPLGVLTVTTRVMSSGPGWTSVMTAVGLWSGVVLSSFSSSSCQWECWTPQQTSWMVPVRAIVVHSTIVWMLTVLSDLFLLIWDQQDLIETAHVSTLPKKFLLGWSQACCLHVPRMYVVSLEAVTAGVLPDIVQPRTVSCNT